jgi:hypothetical protein
LTNVQRFRNTNSFCVPKSPTGGSWEQKWVAYFIGFNFFYESSETYAAFTSPISFLQFFFACVGNVAFYVAFIGIAGVDALLHGASGARPPGQQLFDHPQALAWSLAIAQVCGTIFTAMVLREIVYWYRSDRSPLGGTLIAVILFAFATAFVTAAGRLDYFGLSMAIAARYTTTMLFALGAYILLRGRYLNYYQARHRALPTAAHSVATLWPRGPVCRNTAGLSVAEIGEGHGSRSSHIR